MIALRADTAPDRPALAGLAADVDVEGAGRFADGVWDLGPLLQRRRRAERLYFAAVPVAFRQPAKEFAWLAVRTPAAVRKARPHLDPETIVVEVRHLRGLASWPVERDVTTFSAVTQSLLDDYLSLRRQQLKASSDPLVRVRRRQRCLGRAAREAGQAGASRYCSVTQPHPVATDNRHNRCSAAQPTSRGWAGSGRGRRSSCGPSRVRSSSPPPARRKR
jgi:hypothetical protein